MSGKLSLETKLDWLRLIRSDNVGPRTFRALINHYGGASAALIGGVIFMICSKFYFIFIRGCFWRLYQLKGWWHESKCATKELQQRIEKMSNVGGVNGVYVVVDSKSNVFHVDGSQGGRIAAGTLDRKPRPPYSVAWGLGAGVETCIIADSDGKCWRGNPRGGPFHEVK